MSSDTPAETVARNVQATAHELLTRLQGLLAHGRGRDVKARLSRRTAPDNPELWVALDLTGIHGAEGIDEDTHIRAATAVTAAAQLWATTDLPHRATTTPRPTGLGALLAPVIAARRADEQDVARLLRAHTLNDALPHLRPLLVHAHREGLALDFGLLARDLYTWQTPGGPHRVGQIWALSLTSTRARAARAARAQTTNP
ncbi:type I-E CRISPR-associated protein Cse2/CasB [Streptomyces goshikiensis]|uniref:type I-E CRISPR-associated protein Cse2/CasB n=1 Tax=Streptomyces goshikiensis TaxID=1942 RepID=UPI0036557449